MNSNTLYIMSGLPGVGKTTLAKLLAPKTNSIYLRIDTVEQGLKDIFNVGIEAQGYELSYKIAMDNLKLGISVVADSCNPIDITRKEWESIAEAAGVEFQNIEVVCSDKSEHRKRVENRKPDIENHALPDWQAVEEREYEQWTKDRIVIDTAGKSADESFSELLIALKN